MMAVSTRAVPTTTDSGAVPVRRQNGLAKHRISGSQMRRQMSPVVNEVVLSPGKPLDPESRRWLEPRFGHDFSRVRVHNDTRAAESAKAVGAFAYTVGRNIAFGDGQYAPRSIAGQRLLAHELTHVVQQASAPPETQKQVLVGRTNDPSEREAHLAAESVARGAGRISVQHQVPLTLQRDSFRGDDDPIHKPIIESYRREHGLPLGGVNEFGEPVGPSAAEIKYGRTSKPTEVNVPPPPSQKLSANQAATVANQTLPANVSVSGAPSSPSKPATAGQTAKPFIETLKREPVQFGLDFSIDTTLTKQASILPRHFDIYRISLYGIPIDLGHEPTGSAGLSLNPTNFGTLTALLSISAINVHFQQHGNDFIELALGQIGIGYDSDKNTFVPLTAQAEIHSPNEHFSIYLNGSGTWTHAPGQGWTVTWAPLTMGILFHVLNP
jgi:Domain of unknown function (DUF4157)